VLVALLSSCRAIARMCLGCALYTCTCTYAALFGREHVCTCVRDLASRDKEKKKEVF